VLPELSRVIAECHRLASECGQNARLSCDPKSNEIYSVMERHWNSLAQTYEGIERLTGVWNR
jgi:hypothetical protein